MPIFSGLAARQAFTAFAVQVPGVVLIPAISTRTAALVAMLHLPAFHAYAFVSNRFTNFAGVGEIIPVMAFISNFATFLALTAFPLVSFCLASPADTAVIWVVDFFSTARASAAAQHMILLAAFFTNTARPDVLIANHTAHLAFTAVPSMHGIPAPGTSASEFGAGVLKNVRTPVRVCGSTALASARKAVFLHRVFVAGRSAFWAYTAIPGMK